MKTKNLPLTIIALLLFCFNTSAQESDNLGVISYLLRIKSQAENAMVKYVSSKDYQDAKKSGSSMTSNIAIITDSKYNEVRLLTDQFIVQMMGDLRRRNTLKIYKRVDNAFKEAGSKSLPNGFDQYNNQKKRIDESLNDFLTIGVTTNQMTLMSLGIEDLGLSDAFSALFGVYTSIRDHNEKKVTGISEILSSIRLKEIGAFDSAKDDEKDEKKVKEK